MTQDKQQVEMGMGITMDGDVHLRAPCIDDPTAHTHTVLIAQTVEQLDMFIALVQEIRQSMVLQEMVTSNGNIH